MNIFVACPAAATTRRGNRVTAVRWAAILKELGHRVRIGQHFDAKPCDLLLVLHARKSHAALLEYRGRHPAGRVIVCLTGTDLYQDLPHDPSARHSLDEADRIVVLQPRSLEELTPAWRAKTRVIYQSAVGLKTRPRRASATFEVCVIGHLRAVKDPLRAALALRHVPADVPLRVTQVGEAIETAFARESQRLMHAEPRYRWLGEVPRGATRQLLARSHVMVLSSLLEGGANVIGEAIVLGTPVIASDIPGNRGLLGEDYAGYFPVGDERRLAELLLRACRDASYLRRLRSQCRARRSLFRESRERQAWRMLLRELRAK